MILWTWMMLRILLVLVLDGALGLVWCDELGSLNDNVRIDLDEDEDDNLDDVNEVLDEGVLDDDQDDAARLQQSFENCVWNICQMNFDFL